MLAKYEPAVADVMVQPLPKTDSREFEMANQEAPRVTPNLAVAPHSGCEILLRVWEKTGLGIEPLETSWATKNTLVQLIADLIVASDARLADEPPLAMLARFPNAVRALTVAKRIQRSLPLFAFASSEKDCSVSIVIGKPAEWGAADFEKTVQASGNLLYYARPGRIMITEDICEELQTMPGLQLRKIDSADGEISGAKSIMRELVWEPVPHSPEASEVPEPPLRTSVQKPAAGAESSSANPVTPAGPKKKAQVVELPTRATPPSSPSASRPRHPFTLGPDLPTLGDDTVVSRSRRALIGAAIALAAILILVFSVLLFLSLRRQSETRARRSAPRVNQTKQQDLAPLANTEPVRDNPDAHNDSGQAQRSTPANQTPTGPNPGPDTSSSAGQAPSDEKKSTVKKTRSKEVQDQHERESSAEGYFYSDIPYLLIKADHDAGSGKYSEARHEYQVVLRLDAGNARAKQGLHRLELSAKEPDN